MNEAVSSDRTTPLPLAHELFEAQRRSHPDRLAVLWGERSLDYEELGREADRLAHALRLAGVAGEPVGGLLRTGLLRRRRGPRRTQGSCAYVPLDPAYPDERLAAMVGDSGTRLLLTEKALLDRVPLPDGTRALLLDDALSSVEDAPPPAAPRIGPDTLAYVIYTSGSSGVPKGVAMPHGPLANLIDWQCAHSACGGGDRTLQFSALSFDVSFQEMFSTWASGGTLVVADDTTRRSWQALIDLLNTASVRRMFLPFVALQAIAAHARSVGVWPLALREVVTVGYEQLQVTPAVRALFRRLDGAVLVNQYGPSETHVVTSLELRGDPDAWPDQPSIGLGPSPAPRRTSSTSGCARCGPAPRGNCASAARCSPGATWGCPRRPPPGSGPYPGWEAAGGSTARATWSNSGPTARCSSSGGWTTR